ncbi:MAG: NnrS family protein [Proteobacteria bacterium]|nr:NnrS family protein [Pseudomonadota bacterium]
MNQPRRGTFFASSPFLSCGFRPFFLAAALWSAASLAVWISVIMVGVALPSRFDPLSWHIHEMLFGFVMAAAAGFLLTAIANWTQRPPVGGMSLAVLGLLWLAGRVACLLSASLPAVVVVAADLAFPALLLVVVARELVLAHNRRNLPLVLPLAILGLANLFMHLAALGAPLPAGLGWRLGLAAIVVLISVIGGRIVPTFTANWLRQHGRPAPAGVTRLRERLTLGTLNLGMLAWAFAPNLRPVGALLLLAAALNAWRLSRWGGWLARAEPMLLVLHVGYAWLVLGTGLLGFTLLGIAVPQAAAIHALTAGAMGTMVMALMTRVTRGHTGRVLRADPPTVTLYALVTLAALTRVAAALIASSATTLLLASALLWMAAFAGFVLVYGPMLLSARVPSHV